MSARHFDGDLRDYEWPTCRVLGHAMTFLGAVRVVRAADRRRVLRFTRVVGCTRCPVVATREYDGATGARVGRGGYTYPPGYLFRADMPHSRGELVLAMLADADMVEVAA